METDGRDEADVLFGPAGATLPVFNKMEYHIQSYRFSVTEAPTLNGHELDVACSLSGTDVIAGLKALYRSEELESYPSHVAKMASLGRSRVKVVFPGAQAGNRTQQGSTIAMSVQEDGEDGTVEQENGEEREEGGEEGQEGGEEGQAREEVNVSHRSSRRRRT